MLTLVKVLVGAAAYFAALLTLHDMVVFSEVRAEINRAIAGLSPSERNPSPAVRKALELDIEDLHFRVAFDLYREEYWSRNWSNFHTRKLVAVPGWALQLWLWYDRPSIEALRLRMWCCLHEGYGGRRGAEFIAKTTFAKGLNNLTPYELNCVRKFLRARRHNACPEILGALERGGLQ